MQLHQFSVGEIVIFNEYNHGVREFGEKGVVLHIPPNQYDDTTLITVRWDDNCVGGYFAYRLKKLAPKLQMVFDF